MNDLTFFRARITLSLAAVAALGTAPLPAGCDPAMPIRGAGALDRAGPDDVTLVQDRGASNDLPELAATRAAACFVPSRHAHRVPARTIALVTDDPRGAFQAAAMLLHPDALAPASLFEHGGIDPSAIVHRDARLEPGVTIDPGAVVGPRVEIGSGTTIGANTTIGAGVRIGRDCAIDAQVSISHALLGDRVIVQAGARIGHGAAPGIPTGNPGAAWPGLGRVIVQNDVAIGANASIARGGLRDTILGEGSRVAALAIVAGDTLVPRGALFP